MTFTSPAARDSYTDMVLRGIKHLPSIQLVADAIAERMRELNDGRMWMAAHWRRGDCMHLSTPNHSISINSSTFSCEAWLEQGNAKGGN